MAKRAASAPPEQADSGPPAKAAPKRARTNPQADSVDTGSLDWTQTDNASFWLALKKNIDSVLADSTYVNLKTQTPLGIGSGGSAHAFNVDDAIVALTHEPYQYTCSANIFSVRMNCAPNPSPLSNSSIKIMRTRLFGQGAAPLTIMAGILSSDVQNVKSVVEGGQLVILSPEELLMAFWEEFKDHKGDEGWETAARSTRLTICSLDEDNDFLHMASNEREAISDSHTALGKTALGRIYELIYYKKKLQETIKGKVTPKVLAKEFNDHIQIAVSAEKVTDNVCDMAMTVHDRALSLPGVKEVLRDQDDELRHDSVFNSMSKMQAIIEKAKTPELIIWSFRLMAAWRQSGVLSLDSDATSLRALQGRARNSSGYGTVDIMCFKLKLAKYLVSSFATHARLEDKAIASLQPIAVDPFAWRAKYGWPNKTDLPDQTWRGDSKFTPNDERDTMRGYELRMQPNQSLSVNQQYADLARPELKARQAFVLRGGVLASRTLEQSTH